MKVHFQKGPRLRWVLSLGVLTTACWALSSGCTDNQVHREAQLIAQIDSLKALIKPTSEVREEFDQRARPVLVNSYQIKKLQRGGVSDPLVDIARDLQGHPELLSVIPAPEMGGKFGFYNPLGIHLLTTKWVLAEFDDGHGSGHMLLEFSVRDSGKIAWKPLLWATDD
ncbi:MAG: hypothetical protein SGI90_03485 [Candidatus Eisenbacteria bacterium]|nr:hypothetical protein [Candidatus Eisenbacteria bacterium]